MNPGQVQRTINKSVLMVFGCTLLGAAAQVLFKFGADMLSRPTPWEALQNPYIFVGYVLYGCSTVLLILALRRGQLSILYPVIALTYVWVTLLSLHFFKESMNVWKAIGLGIIVFGVAYLGKDGR